MGCVLEGFRLNHLAGLSQGGLEPSAVASLLVSETGSTGRAEISAHHILLKIAIFRGSSWRRTFCPQNALETPRSSSKTGDRCSLSPWDTRELLFSSSQASESFWRKKSGRAR